MLYSKHLILKRVSHVRFAKKGVSIFSNNIFQYVENAHCLIMKDTLTPFAEFGLEFK